MEGRQRIPVLEPWYLGPKDVCAHKIPTEKNQWIAKSQLNLVELLFPTKKFEIYLDMFWTGSQFGHCLHGTAKLHDIYPNIYYELHNLQMKKSLEKNFFFNQTFPQQVHLIAFVYLQSSYSWGRKGGGECHILSPFSKNTSLTWSCIVFWLQQWISLKYIVIIFALVSFLFPDCTRLIPSLPLRRNILSH